jgi:hypothetical protein
MYSHEHVCYICRAGDNTTMQISLHYRLWLAFEKCPFEILNLVYVFLLLSMYSYCCLCILIVRPCILIVVYIYLDAATLTEVFPCFFLGCKANARVKLAKTGHGPPSSKIVVLFYVLFVLYRSMYCLCVNVYCTSTTA